MSKIDLLHATHQILLKEGLGILPLTYLEGIIAPDYMGIGTTMDEKMFSPEDLYALIRRQEEQREGIEIQVQGIHNIHTRIAADVGSALFVDDIVLVAKVREEEMEIPLRFSSVFEFVENKWLAIHTHGSKPELLETEKDTWGIEEWKQKTAELEQKVAERTKELVEKNRELQSTQAQLIQSQKQEALRVRELDEFKSRFFTNITHEFRTPLTVILGMSEQVLSDRVTQSYPATIAQPISLIKRNGENLLRLVNQILDLTKLESNTLKMDYVQGDILAFTRYIAESLHPLANAQNLMLRVESNQGQIVMDYDPERFLQIIHNLLSNAIKFTPSSGKVVLRLTVADGQQTDPYAVITVTDTGVGIAPEELPHIFERFFQAKNQDHTKAGGSGIGLSLARELVKAMGGEISVESTLGLGSTFSIKLPITNKSAFEEKQTGIEAHRGPYRVGITASHADTMVQSRSFADAPTILLIEDNADVVEYLIACLPDHYALDFAYNGQAGIEKALENIPDLIVSDVMMPLKDGFEVLDALKNDERTSHIPIILLTAKADVQSRMAGLRRGADAYLAKPFQQKELLVTIENLLELRRKLQLKYQQNILAPELAASAVPPADPEDTFLQQVRAIIASNYQDEDFGLPQLCQKVGMSRSQLFRKMKALVDIAPSDMIRLHRLRKAKILLESGAVNVSEAAWQTGFKYPSYFSKLYREEFGVAPGEV